MVLGVHLQIPAHVFWIAEGGTFEVHHDLLGGNHKLSKTAKYLDIYGLRQSCIVSLYTARLQPGGKTGEHLEMVAAKEDNCSPVEDDTDLYIAWNECFGLVHFQH